MLQKVLTRIKSGYHWLCDFFSSFLEINNLSAIKKLKRLLSKVEFYQPLYNYPFIKNKQPQRPCLDRAQTVLQHLQKFGSGMKLVDLGASLGYFCYFFAHQGYKTTGIERHRDNVAVAKALRYFNPAVEKQVTFLRGTLDRAFVEKLKYRQYDVAFIFSVLHHINHFQGLQEVQILLKNLTDKIPILFVELAIKNESVKSIWRKSLPENILDYFNLCENIHLELLGYFPTHLSDYHRPLYCITKTKLSINQQHYPIEHLKFTAHETAKYCDRAYYASTPYFIKEYLNTRKRNRLSIVQEKTAYDQLKNHTCENLPQLIQFVEQKRASYFIMNNLPGDSLFTLLCHKTLSPETHVSIVKQVIQTLAYLRKNAQLYHNDVRLWNILYHQEKIYLIDLSHAGTIEKEQSTLSLLWLIYQLSINYPYFQLKNKSYPLTEKPNFENVHLPPILQEWVQLLLNAKNFDAFLEKLTF